MLLRHIYLKKMMYATAAFFYVVIEHIKNSAGHNNLVNHQLLHHMHWR